MNLDDLNAAARLKEVVSKIAAEVVESMYPRPKFATVVSVDLANKKVVLEYAGDATDVTVDGTQIMPDAGGVVRVAGKEGARYVDEVMSGGVAIAGDLTATNLTATELTTAEQLHGTKSDSGTSFGEAGVLSGSGGSKATLALWVTDHASQFRMSSAGNITYLRDWNDGAYPPFYCDVVDMSSRRYKRSIQPYRRSLSAGMESALDSLMRVEVVSYKRNKASLIPTNKAGEFTEGRQAALDRLNEYRANNDLPLYERHHEHDESCAVPCLWDNEERDMPGVIAEQLHEVLPEVVQYGDSLDTPEGIKTLSLLAVTIKALQEATLRIEALEVSLREAPGGNPRP